MFVSRTIQDILDHSEADIEIIATLDGKWADPEIPQNDRVNIIYVPESIGQRSATNLACKLAKGKYVMKVDAHCGFDQGFDRKMLEAFKETGDNVVMAPLMRNLWAFDWKCMKCGKKTYQGITPTKCENCDNTTNFKRKMMWVSKKRPESTAYCFDPEPHFQYHGDQRRKQTGDIVETMSLQGSAWMMTREKYWDLNVCDEAFGSWGSQGIEISCKFWLSGGRVLVNKKTFYSHLFRTKGGDFGFPYPQSGKQVQHAKKYAKELFFENKWPKQIYPLSWLVEKFWPVPGWTQEQLDNLKLIGSKFVKPTISISSPDTVTGLAMPPSTRVSLSG
jgi:glycosyltransferase involved in cell wall biosynthesis